MIPQESSTIANRKFRVLLADDDPIFCELAIAKLSGPATIVEAVPDGLAAWDRLRAQDHDVALIDIEMPGLDGFSLVERIRADEDLRHLPAVMVTSHDDVASIDRAFAAGATWFITKPVNWLLVAHQLRYVLRTSEMSAEVREARARAEAASALKANMLSLLHHEIRTPLHAIIGFASLLNEMAAHGERSEHLGEYTAHIVSASEELHNKLRQIQRYAAITTREYRLREDQYRLSSVLAETVATVPTDPQVRGRLAFPVDLAPNVNIVCDRDLLVIMLAGLLDNALVHGGDGAVKVDVGLDEQAGDLLIAISDEGPGMSAMQIEAALLPFGQAERPLTRSTPGLGLGLAIAQEILRLHQGALRIDSHPGIGTTVGLRLPARRIITTRPAAAPRSAGRKPEAVATAPALRRWCADSDT
jgi:signal transduction histidine kinase